MENRNNNQTIVITSIFNPTEAVSAFSLNKAYKLVVVGDKKTPKDWSYEGVDYLSVDDQQSIGSYLKDLLPYNHYCRKMMGYIYAIKNGSEVIVDTDDDNIPNSDWNFPNFQDEFDFIKGKNGFVNIYELFTEQKIWPRGLPLRLINTKFDLSNSVINQEARVGVWQGLADEDPDVDAIYRLTNNAPCYFDRRKPVVLDKGAITPFNSQNTAFRKELFPLLYLPTYVTFRFTDILRGLVAQPIMWLYDYHLGITDATVIQKRNPHDYFKDFVSEIPMYQYSEDVVDLVTGSTRASSSIEENLFVAYEALNTKGIVEAKELQVLNAWLKDIS